MSSQKGRTDQHRNGRLFQVIFVVIFLFSLLGVQPAQEVLAQTPTKVAAISDYGVAISDTHKAAIATLIKNWAPDAVVTGGDNYHDRNPSCSSYAACVAGYNNNTTGYTDFVSSGDFFPSYGNHDAMHSAAYTSYFTYLPSSPDPNHLYYDVVVGDIHFWVLNGNVTLSGSAQQTWLANNAPNSTSPWNIVIVHQAPYSTGTYGDLTATQLPYQNYGIDFVLSGHNHHYERLVKNGVRYFVLGKAGNTDDTRNCDGTGSSATVEFCAGTQSPALNNYGYTQIEATPTSISFKFLDEGGTVRDTYSQTTVEPTDPAITVSPSSLSFTSQTGEFSDIKTYTVSGVRLQGNVTITPPANFEISTTGGAGFTPTNPITLSPTSGTLAATPIYVRFSRASAGTSTGNITHTSLNATTSNVAVTGTASVPLGAWVAYNDCAWASGQLQTKITQYTITSGSTTGLLVDYESGNQTPVTATFTSSGSPQVQTGQYGGSETAAGTDAYGAFHGFVDMPGVIQYGSSGWYVVVTFTGLSPDKTYTFITSANRDNDYTDRFTKFTLQDADAAINTSSAGVTRSTTTINEDTSVFNTGENTDNGYVASWANIVPGSDGDFAVRAQANSGTNAYAFSVFKLAEEIVTTDPTIYVTGSLTPFMTQPGVASAVQSYTVSGVNLDGPIVITPPAGFEVSTASGSGFGSGLNLTPTSGTVASTPIYVRLFSATTGTFGGDITHTSGTATQKNIAATGSVSNQVCYTDQSFVASADAYISGYNTTYNYGAQTYMRVTLGTTQARGSLIRWDLSSLPTNAVISNPRLQLYVSTQSSATYNLYNMRRAWVEGTQSGAVPASGEGATFATYDGNTAHTWGTNGAANTSSDRYDTNLWGAGSSSFSTTGSKTIALNSDGLVVVQGWVTGTLANYGLTIQNYTTGTTDVQFSTKENATTANRPRLILDYCVGEATTTYDLEVAIAPTSSGSVTLSPAGGTYDADSVVTLTPVPASGYQFSSWSGANVSDIINTGGVYTIVMNGNKAVTANFTLIPVNYSLSVSVAPAASGSVALSPSGGTYNAATVVTLTPVPASGYQFSSWSGTNASDIVNTGGIYTLTMNGNKAVTANFTLIPSNAPTDILLSNSSVMEGQAVGALVGTLSAIDADAGETFTFSLVAGTGSTDNASFTISGNQLLTAESFDYDTKSSYSIRVQVSDSDALTFAKAFTISILPVGVTPPLPSSFYGRIEYMDGDGGPVTDDLIEVFLDDQTTPIWNADIEYYAGYNGLVYSINVPAYPNGVSPDNVTFKIDGRIVAIADWVSGTNVSLNIHPPKADAGGPYVSLVSAGSAALDGTVSDWGTDIDTNNWDFDEDGSFDDSALIDPTFSFTSAGTYPVSLKAVDLQGGEGLDTSQVFAITLSGLTGQVYNANPHPVTVAGVESPFTYKVLYGNPGTETPPTNAGTYYVLVQILSGTDVVGSYSTEMVIAKATASVSLGNLSQTYDGTTKAASATTNPTGLTVNLVYNPTNPVNAGSYTVTATIVDTNYQGTASGTLVINKATATVTLANLSHTYDGAAKAATATTVPASLTVNITYNPANPLNAGSYAVTATIDNANYQGTASGTLVIAKATAAVNLSNLEQQYNGSPRPVTVSTVPTGLAVVVTYGGSTTVPSAVGSYAIVATVNETNYQGSATGTLVISGVTQSIDLEPGWNLVSFNIIPTSPAISDVLNSIAGKYNLVYGWDAGVTTSNWLRFDPNVGYGNTLNVLDDTMGFWIYMNQEATLTVIGTQPTTTDINLSIIAGGWNLIGFPALQSAALPAALTEIEDSYNLIFAYHAVDTSDPWKVFDLSAPAWSNDLTEMAPGWGYWIFVTENTSLTITYE